MCSKIVLQIHFLLFLKKSMGTLRNNDNAWNGWQILYTIFLYGQIFKNVFITLWSLVLLEGLWSFPFFPTFFPWIALLFLYLIFLLLFFSIFFPFKLKSIK